MIITSKAIRAAGHARHLLNTASNRVVEILRQHGRDDDGGVERAIDNMAAISRSNPRCKRELFSVAVSPAKAMTDDDLEAVIAIIEAEHGIPQSTPRLVVRHAKGDRADHFHIVYSLVDPATGRAIKTQSKQFQDELASRHAELLLGEDIVPGVNQAKVVAELEMRPEYLGQAKKLERDAPERLAHISPAARQQAQRCGADAPAILTRAFRAFEAADGDRDKFLNALGKHRIFLGAGRKAAILVDEETGFTHALARGLRIGAKIAGQQAEVRERDLARMLGQLESLELIEESCRKSAELHGLSNVKQQARLFQREAELDRDDDAMKWLGERRLLLHAQQIQEIAATQKARRERIRVNLKDAEEIGKRRLDRAFLATGIAETPHLRKVAVLAAGAGVLLAGGGLGLALMVGGVAAGALPEAERVRAVALDETLAKRRERTPDHIDLASALGRFRRTARAILPRPSPIPEIPRRTRPAAAGFVRAQFLPVDAVEQYLDRAQDNFLRFLGRKLIDMILADLLGGNGRTALVANRAARRAVYVRELKQLKEARQERSAPVKKPDLKPQIVIQPPLAISPGMPIKPAAYPPITKSDGQKPGIGKMPVAQQERQTSKPGPQAHRTVTLKPKGIRRGKAVGNPPRSRSRDRSPER